MFSLITKKKNNYVPRLGNYEISQKKVCIMYSIQYIFYTIYCMVELPIYIYIFIYLPTYLSL